MDPYLLIKKTAEAIQRGVKPYKLIDNPQKILSGETKKIVLNKKEKGIILYEEQIKQLEAMGMQVKDLEWKGKYNNKIRYVNIETRDDPTLILAVEGNMLKDFVIVELPVEEWSWVIKFITTREGVREYVEMLL